MDLGEAIRITRQRAFYTQEGFAQKLNVALSTVNRWESGKCKPTFKTMKLIDNFCKAKGIDFDISEELLDEK